MKRFSIILFLAIFSIGAHAKPLIYQKSGLAMAGYDPVAYFSLTADAAPIKGVDAFSFEYQGATWQFATADNLAAFQADPEKYMPQYGGYCAWAISAKNKLVKTDPRDWKVYDGRLYLNYSAQLRAKWEADPDSFIPKGDANWAEHRKSLSS